MDENITNQQSFEALPPSTTGGYFGSPTADIYLGEYYNEEIYGNGGDDILHGAGGDDTIYGGEGNDTLEGGIGSDTYIFQKGYGQDIINNFTEINDTTEIDTLKMVGIREEEVYAVRDGQDLILNIKYTNDKMVVKGYFNNGTYSLEKIIFDGNVAWDVAKTNKMVLRTTVEGTEANNTISGIASTNTVVIGKGGDDIITGINGNDLLYGGDGDDKLSGGLGNDDLYGGAGNDKLYGESVNPSGTEIGNDILDGGTGNDFLYGGYGVDTYIFKRGYGEDTINNSVPSGSNSVDILKMIGIKESEVKAVRESDDLLLIIKETNDSVRIQNYFKGGSYSLGKMVFDDVEWDVTKAKEKAMLSTIEGTEEIDKIVAFSNFNTIVNGKGGEDTISGNNGDDVFYGGTGNDTLSGSSGSDTLRGENDDDILLGGIGDDELYGGAGNDKLYGESVNPLGTETGNDILDGGTGNDFLYGGYGVDTYIFKRGYGEDTINNSVPSGSNSVDILKMIGIKESEVKAVRESDDLLLIIKETNDSVRIQNYFKGGSYSLGKMVFDDVEWDVTKAKEKAMLSTIEGTEEIDKIVAFSNFNTIVNGKGGEDTISGNNGDDVFYGGTGNDTLSGSSGSDTLRGENDDDILLGGIGDDELYGGAGNDKLYGESVNPLGTETGNDILDGGTGNDFLYGGYGVDTYIFRRGYGEDTINNSVPSGSNSVDILKMIGIKESEVKAVRESDDLLLIIKETNDSVRIQNYFKGGSYSLGKMVFDDVEWDAAKVNAIVVQERGSSPLDGNDTLIGTEGSDTLYGGLGDDTLKSLGGNDILEGGAGTDILEGGSGNDIYIFKKGYREDTIINSTLEDNISEIDTLKMLGITEDEVKAVREGQDLRIFVKETGEGVKIKDYFNYGSSAIDKIVFEGNVEWDIAKTKEKAMLSAIEGTEVNDTLVGYSDFNNIIKGYDGDDNITGSNYKDELYGGNGNDIIVAGVGDDSLEGGAGIDNLDGGTGNDLLNGGYDNDTLKGGDGNDILIGGSGYDILEGGNGNDTYIFKQGFRQDIINNSNTSNDITEVDILKMEGLKESDVRVSRQGQNLILGIRETGEYVKVQGYFNYDSSALKKIIFDGNVEWDIEKTRQVAMATTIEGTEGRDIIQGYSDFNNKIVAKGGDDEVTGSDNNDTLDGGAGIDILNGKGGNDTLIGGMGNDSLLGGTGNDSLLGGIGNDILKGEAGDDTLNGGIGNDTLIGGYGTDIYKFKKGFGQDIIINSNETNAFELDRLDMDGIKEEEVKATREGQDLVLIIKETEESIRIQDYFTYGSSAISKIKFDDAEWNITKVKEMAMANVIEGTEGDDQINAYSDFDTKVEGRGGIDTILGDSGNDNFKGEGGNDILTGGSGNDVLDGGDGDDSLDGGQGDDLLVGGNGNDTINAGSGNDTLNGGSGNDTLSGDIGDDIYIFKKGYGQDIIDNHTATINDIDILKMDGIKVEDIDVIRQGKDLILIIKDTKESLTIQGYFNYGTYSLDKIVFDGNVEWDVDKVKEIIRYIEGTEAIDTIQGFDDLDNVIQGYGGADIITGGSNKDSIFGGSGNDNIHGNDGIDILSGGNEDDSLYGDDGNDILKGELGNDTLYGGLGNDSLDGAEGDDTLFGEQGDDSLVSGIGNDILDGGLGNDYLVGGLGNDTYTFQENYGQDIINNLNVGANNSEVDILNMVGIQSVDVTAVRSGQDLILKVKEKNDSVSIQGYFNYDSAALSNIIFADNVKWDVTKIKEMPITVEGTDNVDTIIGFSELKNIVLGKGGTDIITGSSNADTLDGGLGNDMLAGGAGDDILKGGDGDDSLTGGIGNDILDGEQGNDHLIGSYGNDTYIFRKGYGEERIENYDSGTNSSDIDVLKMVGIMPEEVKVLRENDDLILTIKDTNDKVTIQGYFNYGSYAVNKIVFENNVEWDITKTKEIAMLEAIEGTDAGENLTGFDDFNTILMGKGGDDIIQGKNGNDKLFGDDGTDYLDGGSGDDSLFGGSGNDTYIFKVGYGQDTINNYTSENDTETDILKMDGVNVENIIASKDDNSLILSISGTNDSVRIQDYFNGGTSSLDRIIFQDGVELGIDYIKSIVDGSSSTNSYSLVLEKSIETIAEAGDSGVANIAQDTSTANSSADQYLFNLSN
ncbi:calcium-binding protein [Clostridium cellulovorans]|uniref:Hemolysin-type calcium-binding region n=1 Tax=Clostridium cellulovorans (strain ATCC 35296 / DSM 3052 / OCM 3 / 743B) TaxID=573061 RepID=D9SQ42_CLOC7|nr:calcium-binding protein [Clostridium cellulovorans]ADL52178.1 Hemolysin-type calcium-binding region [Clostridium cellulovorans 743B]